MAQKIEHIIVNENKDLLIYDTIINDYIDWVKIVRRDYIGNLVDGFVSDEYWVEDVLSLKKLKSGNYKTTVVLMGLTYVNPVVYAFLLKPNGRILKNIRIKGGHNNGQEYNKRNNKRDHEYFTIEDELKEITLKYKESNDDRTIDSLRTKYEVALMKRELVLAKLEDRYY